MIGTQSIGVINSLEALDPTDLSLENPSMDAKSIAMTYPIESAWLNPEPLLFNQAGFDISAAPLTAGIGALVKGYPAAADFNRAVQQIWTHIRVELGGAGTTSPLVVELTYEPFNGSATTPLISASVANPGSVTFGPIYCPPGWQVLVTTTTAGGAGDTADVSGAGFQAPLGVPLFLMPTTGAIIQ